MSTASNDITGVVLMTYGSATIAENVREYFESIYKGKASDALIQDFENRYRLVGHSPLIEITRLQASLLEQLLGDKYVVRAGMRHSPPTIQEAIADCKAHKATSLIGIILSPQFSSVIMDGYTKAFMEAAALHGFTEKAKIAGPWNTEQHFVDLLAQRTQSALLQLNKKFNTSVPVVFTTHSLPLRVVEEDLQYLEQLKDTVDAIRENLDQNIEWYAGYQSAGHTPEEWLKPDLMDILEDLHKKEVSAVLIVPIQFLADHLEILYDLDIAARAQCEQFGISYNRTELPNTDPLFIEALAAIVRTQE